MRIFFFFIPDGHLSLLSYLSAWASVVIFRNKKRVAWFFLPASICSALFLFLAFRMTDKGLLLVVIRRPSIRAAARTNFVSLCRESDLGNALFQNSRQNQGLIVPMKKHNFLNMSISLENQLIYLTRPSWSPIRQLSSKETGIFCLAASLPLLC